jgi:ubiquinone/menaquinone biosynthesis C-methylase UbiE
LPENIKKVKGSIMNMDFPDNYFDFVFCVEALEHSINPSGAIKELCRVLTPKGKIIIIDKNRKKLGALNIEEWEQWYDKDHIEKILKNNRCKNIRSDFISYEDQKANGLFISWKGIKND